MATLRDRRAGLFMILFRYFLREIIQATLAVSFVLLLIVMSGRLAKYLAQASSGDLAVDVVFLVVLYRIPDFLPLVLPLGFFIGILLAYGRLYVESEMVVTQACGIGKRYLLLVTLLPAALVAAIVAYLSLLGAPESLSKATACLLLETAWGSSKGQVPTAPSDCSAAHAAASLRM